MASEKLLNQLNANNDHGLWLESDWRINLTPLTIFTLRSEHRFGSDYRLMWYQEYMALIHYEITRLFCPNKDSLLKKVNIGAGYAGTEILQRNTRGIFHRDWVLRPAIEYNLFFSWHKWDMQQRFRIEYHKHLRSHYKDFTGYRFRLTLNAPWKFTSWKINPFVFNEWFFRNNSFSRKNPKGLVGNWHQNRFRVGLDFEPIEKFFTTLLYWQWRTIKKKPGTHPLWFNTYEWGAIFNFAF